LKRALASTYLRAGVLSAGMIGASMGSRGGGL
jgi:hypothetical protein